MIVEPDGLKKTLITLSIGVILLNLFRVILNAFRSYLLLYLSQKLDVALLLGYYRHVMDLPMNFFGTRKVGEIISNKKSDVDEYQQFVEEMADSLQEASRKFAALETDMAGRFQI